MVGNDRSDSSAGSSQTSDADRTVVSSNKPAAPETTVPVIDAPAPSAGSKALAPGVLLGHTYRIEALLARGGMGEVYRARHEELGSLHAIKVILDALGEDARIINMFQEEAKKLRRVRDDAVVGYEGLFRDEFGRRYLVMELVDGPSLSDIMKERKLTLEEVGILRDRMARGLGAAHEKGIYHRDISPDNVIFPGGRVENAKIIDFGIAKSADPSDRTVIGDEFAGKYSYVSPEQLGMYSAKVDGRSDMYSLGLVLVAALLGRKLDMGASIVQAIEARRGVPDLSAVPASLRPEIERMLQPQPDDRLPNIRDLISGNDQTQLQPAGGRGAVPDAGKAKRGGLIGVAALATAVVVVGGGLYAVMGTGSTPKPVTTATSASPPGEVPAAAPSASLPAVLPQDTTPAPAVVPPPASTVTAAPPAQPASGVTSAPAVPAATTPVAPPANAPAANIAVANVPPVTAPPTSTPPTSTAVASVPAVTAPALPIAPVPPAPATATVPPPVAPTRPVQEAAVVPPPTATLAPPKANPAVVRATLQQILGGYSCARLSGQLGSDLTGTVTGFVETTADASRLRAQLAGLPDARLSTDVSVHGWPHCGVLSVLAADTREQGTAPALQIDRPTSVYKAGQTLNVKATMAKAGLLYVDYIDGAGQVVHLLPNPVERQNRLSAGQQVSLGKPKGSNGPDDRVYEMGPPYGANMIVAITSTEPLFPQERPEVEDAKTYLPALTERLQSLAAKGAEASSATRFFDSAP